MFRLKGWSILLALAALVAPALAQVCPAPFDFAYLDNLSGGRNGYYTPNGPPLPSSIIDFSQPILVPIFWGQSNNAMYAGDPHALVNTSKIFQISIQDGGIYAITNGIMLGASLNPANGSIPALVVDLLAPNFNQIFAINVSVTNTRIDEWDSTLYTKVCAGIQRLAEYGITPTTPNVTFVMSGAIGESDNAQGTPQAPQQASYASVFAKFNACGFPVTSRSFLRTASYVKGVVSAAVTNAQAWAIANVPGVWQGAFTDPIGKADRCDDDIHFTDFTAARCISFGGTGASAGATKVSILDRAAMAASGPPF